MRKSTFIVSMTASVTLGMLLATGAQGTNSIGRAAEPDEVKRSAAEAASVGLTGRDWVSHFDEIEFTGIPIEGWIDSVQDDKDWLDLSCVILRENNAAHHFVDVWYRNDAFGENKVKWSDELKGALHQYLKDNSSLQGIFAVFRDSLKKDPERLKKFRAENSEAVVELTKRRRFLMIRSMIERLDYNPDSVVYTYF